MIFPETRVQKDADILMYCPENGNLHIIETTLSEEQFEKLLPELMAQTKQNASGV